MVSMGLGERVWLERWIEEMRSEDEDFYRAVTAWEGLGPCAPSRTKG